MNDSVTSLLSILNNVRSSLEATVISVFVRYITTKEEEKNWFEVNLIFVPGRILIL
jgi:hypothetical protein